MDTLACPIFIDFLLVILFLLCTGQFMKKGINIDTQRKMLIYPDGQDPVPVTRDSSMTGKWCWKAENYGFQGEGLIDGDILDYFVPNILGVAENLEKFFKIETKSG